MIREIISHPLVLSLLIIVFFVFMNAQGWLNLPQDFISRITAPAQRVAYQSSLAASSFLNFLKSISELKQVNQALQSENQSLLSQLVELKETARENQFLRQQLDLPGGLRRNLILADVISQDSSAWGNYLLIDKGKKDGVTEKAAVITSGNFLVGQITETTDYFSKVQLITDVNIRIGALLQETRETGLVRGDKDSLLVMDLLPQGEAIKPGEWVVTSGLARLFPSGLLIGQVEEVISFDAQIAQKARIRPAVNPKTLEKVFIVIH